MKQVISSTSYVFMVFTITFPKNCKLDNLCKMFIKVHPFPKISMRCYIYLYFYST